MEPIPKSGYYYPNKYGLIAIKALEEVVGKNGLNAILNLAHLTNLIDNYPQDNLELAFDFSDLSSINQALEEMYGSHGGRGLALLIGRAIFMDGLRHFGALVGMEDMEFRALPLQVKLHIGLPALAKVFSQVSDQSNSVMEYENEFIYTIHRCPVCWGRSVLDKPVCYVAAGLIQASLKWISGGMEFGVHETKCFAMGNENCEFVVNRTPAG
jgi:predicted hydrocarbon binding protein